jgi:hypothetical protein
MQGLLEALDDRVTTFLGGSMPTIRPGDGTVIKSRTVGYNVWFSTDEDASVVVAISAMQDDGATRQVSSKRFGPYTGWDQVADHVWNEMRLDLPLDPF